MDLQSVWELVKSLAEQMVNSEYDKLPGNTTKEKEDAAVSWVKARVEGVDHLIPAIGQYMDLPIVDLVESVVIDRVTRELLRLVIRREYAVMKIAQATAA